MDINGKYKKDALGMRIKSSYEDRTRYSLPRRTYTIIRLDGKAFHTYTKGLKKPFDKELIDDLDTAVKAILPQIQGAVFAYVQSDEISILLTDFEKDTTDAWFDGNIQKICSVSASLMTAEFNQYRFKTWLKEYSKALSESDLHTFSDGQVVGIEEFRPAAFDSRVFTIPDRTEVMNYFIWRNQDCTRNSVSMVAQSLYSHKELHGKNSSQLQEMIFQKGINWADYDPSLKNGRVIIKEKVFDLDEITPENIAPPARTRWTSQPAWKFTQDKDKLLTMIPEYQYD